MHLINCEDVRENHLRILANHAIDTWYIYESFTPFAKHADAFSNKETIPINPMKEMILSWSDMFHSETYGIKEIILSLHKRLRSNEITPIIEDGSMLYGKTLYVSGEGKNLEKTLNYIKKIDYLIGVSFILSAKIELNFPVYVEDLFRVRYFLREKNGIISWNIGLESSYLFLFNEDNTGHIYKILNNAPLSEAGRIDDIEKVNASFAINNDAVRWISQPIELDYSQCAMSFCDVEKIAVKANGNIQNKNIHIMSHLIESARRKV